MLLNKAVILSLFPTLVAAQGIPIQRGAVATIAASASADAKFTPDRARISISVQTKAPTASVAAADNAMKQNAVMAALRKLGLPDKQMSTSGYNVNPEYSYQQDHAPTLTGYTVTNSVLVDIHDIKQIGKILDSALANGSNLVSSLDFYASNTDAAHQQALTDAVVKARADAEVAARAAGGELGALLHLNVGSVNVPEPPRPMFAAKAMAASTPETRINPGQQSITVSVSGDWRFVPNQ